MYSDKGVPISGKHPAILSASYLRRLHHLGKTDEGDRLVRAHTCWCVILLKYGSKFDIVPVQREYFVHAPMDPGKAAHRAMKMWRRWEQGPMPDVMKGEEPIDLRDAYPKLDDGAVAIPMADEDYDAHWRDAKRSSKTSILGDPDDPFAFTCFNQDIMLFKTSDFQEGLHITI